MGIFLHLTTLGMIGAAAYIQYFMNPGSMPVLEKLAGENSAVLVVCATLFVNLYHLNRNTIFLVTSGLSTLLIGAQFTSPWITRAAATLIAVGFGLQSTSMPSRCKLYSLGFTMAYMAGDGPWQVTVYFTVFLVIRRLLILLITAQTSFPATYIFGFISNLLPAYYFSKHDFFRSDDPPEEVAELRERAWDRMQTHWDGKWPKSLEASRELRKAFSDLRFAAGNRVFLPFRKIADSWCDPFTVTTQTDRMNLIDLDGHSQLDISGSYGVNVVGYDRYKEFITKGWEKVKDLGCVLGPVHPLLLRNVELLKGISKMEEVSFHMSGTEAVMSAVRLARFNTKKPLVCMFAGAYHGWWDGVQSTAGNERNPDDVLTLVDLAESSLRVLSLRASEIAAVMVNPLQAFHANSPPPSDVVLATDNRKSDLDRTKYSTWLQRLKTVCHDNGIVLIFDEVYTGFRLGPGGAQEYFDCQADMVCYGKTLGGGIANGVVCGSTKLMARCDPNCPLRLAYVVGTFSAHPLLLGAMNEFLEWVVTPQARALYEKRHNEVLRFVVKTNKALEDEDLPIKLASYCTVWTMLFQVPGRYHWIFQYYLKDEGINLSWVGTGRLNFSLDFTEEDLDEVRVRLLKAARRMKEDGWWYYDPSRQPNNLAIKLKLGKEVVGAMIKSAFL